MAKSSEEIVMAGIGRKPGERRGGRQLARTHNAWEEEHHPRFCQALKSGKKDRSGMEGARLT